MPGQYKHKHNIQKVGMPPGTLLHTGSMRNEKIKISMLCYSKDDWTEQQLSNVDELLQNDCIADVNWIHISGIHIIDVIEKIGNKFKVHPLVMEDIVNNEQRPKLEESKEYIYIVLKMINYYEQTVNIEFEQISIIIIRNYIISFQENDNHTFQQIRDRIKKTNGTIRTKGVDYLAYALIDCIVDHYYIALEYLGEKIESLEDKLMLDPGPNVLKEIHSLKTEMLFVRKAIWPLREIINALARGDSVLFSQDTLIYLRDVYDHIIQVIDTIEMYRDMVTGMFDIYISSVSYKLNEVMKILTIIATIFIPLTFIVGLYGMNFKYMPELEWEWGYPAVLIFMGVISTFMIIYFKRKNWIGNT
ncbi:MAG: magnesium Mg(2+) and cobalt Co(2+) transport protein CorA [Firmicutes bacterium]|nr:magnesium Mg(2+) and cobalt Co(2+) transport protein CorA [Bacillota bacterium]